jgi:hypothetical protein
VAVLEDASDAEQLTVVAKGKADPEAGLQDV